MELFAIGLIALLNIASLYIGTWLGQKVVKGEKIDINPVEAIKERIQTKKAKDEADREAEKINTILENIENYDGSSRNQKEVR